MNITNKSKNNKIWWLGLCGCLMLIMLSIAQAQEYTGECTTPEDVTNLPPGHWCEVSNSPLMDVEKKPWEWEDYDEETGQSACYNSYHGSDGVKSVIKDWSGGAYDTKRDRLIVWGGGHGAYGGNELYAFDLNNLSWKRLTDPSCLTANDRNGDCELEKTGYYEDGMPRSRHTYDFIQYVPAIDRFCSLGSGGFFKSGACGASRVDCFNFETLEWEQRNDTIVRGSEAFSDVDQMTGRVWVRGTHNNRGLAEYDPINDVWTMRDKKGEDYSHKTAAIEPKQRLLIVPGNGDVRMWNIDQSGDLTMEILETFGDQEIVNAKAPGFVYDELSEKLVGWNGGADIYTLNLDTNTWAKHLPAATNMVIPTEPAANPTYIIGTYGRFRYSPNKNVFMIVNSVDENVYIYRFSPSQSDNVAPSPPIGLKVK